MHLCVVPAIYCDPLRLHATHKPCYRTPKEDSNIIYIYKSWKYPAQTKYILMCVCRCVHMHRHIHMHMHMHMYMHAHVRT